VVDNIAIVISVIILLGMAVLHILLLLGFPLGEYVLGGENRVMPKNKRYLNVIFSAIWLFAIIVYLEKGEFISFFNNPLLTDILFIVFTIFFGIAIFSNGFLTSSKKEKYVMTPLCILIFVCSVLIFF
jgi:hypothetical protein